MDKKDEKEKVSPHRKQGTRAVTVQVETIQLLHKLKCTLFSSALFSSILTKHKTQNDKNTLVHVIFSRAPSSVLWLLVVVSAGHTQDQDTESSQVN